MKRIIIAIIFTLMLILTFSACQRAGAGGSSGANHVCNRDEVRIYTEDPTCQYEGEENTNFYCSVCGNFMDLVSKSIDKLPHTPNLDMVEKEYINYPTCYTEGLYVEKTYCCDCGELISETEKTEEKTDEHDLTTRIENRVESTCAKEGSYDEVEYCISCNEIFERETHTIEKKKHTSGAAVKENVIPASCDKIGTYDEVVYCKNAGCGIELSRVEKTLDKSAHTPKGAVIENEKPANCTSKGSYESVVYCGVCDAELSRKTEEIPITHQNDAYGICTVCDPNASRGLRYKEYESCCEVAGRGTCYDDDIIIPSMYNGKPIEYISDSAFSGCDFKSITISKNITKIGKRAFENCSKLENIIFTEGELKYIEDYAFAGSALKSIEIPLGVTHIYGRAFYDCVSLESISVPISVRYIGENAFDKCSGLNKVCIRDASAWGAISFSNKWANPLVYAKNLYIDGELAKDITISYSDINEYAFNSCESLRTVTIGNGVTKIGNYAFNGCKNLIIVTISESVISIGDYSFTSCSRITEIVNNSGCSVSYGGGKPIEVHTGESKVVNKDGYWFYSYNGENYLIGYVGTDTELILPENYNGEKYLIHDSAFSGLDFIKTAKIPSGVKYIGEYAFSSCNSLESIIIEGDASIYRGAFADTALKEFVSDKLLYLYDSAFYNCQFLKKIVLTNVVLQADDYSKIFYACPIETAIVNRSVLRAVPKTNLKHLTVSGYNAQIGTEEFKDCNSLITLVIGDGVIGIMDRAFLGCENLISLTIGKDVTSIGTNAFYGCNRLVEVINLSSLDIKAGYEGTLTNYVREVHTGESKIVNKNGYLFYTCDGVNYLVAYIGTDTELVLPESYNGETYEINHYAFYNCKNLTSVTISNNVTYIGGWSFRYCTGLTNIEIPIGVSIIDCYAFANCTSLVEVSVSKYVEHIEDYAFFGCTALENLTIKNNNTGKGTVISYSAFAGCKSLKEVIIPDGVTAIYNSAFYGCDSLTDVTIGNGVTFIGLDAFSVEVIKYRGSEEEWNAIYKDENWNQIDEYTVIFNCGDK